MHITFVGADHRSVSSGPEADAHSRVRAEPRAGGNARVRRRFSVLIPLFFYFEFFLPLVLTSGILLLLVMGCVACTIGVLSYDHDVSSSTAHKRIAMTNGSDVRSTRDKILFQVAPKKGGTRPTRIAHCPQSGFSLREYGRGRTACQGTLHQRRSKFANTAFYGGAKHRKVRICLTPENSRLRYSYGQCGFRHLRLVGEGVKRSIQTHPQPEQTPG